MKVKRYTAVLYLSAFLFSTILLADPGKLARVEVANAPHTVANGDKLFLKGENFTPQDEIDFVVLTLLDEDHKSLTDIVLEDHALYVNSSGYLTGHIFVTDIPIDAAGMHVAVFARRSDVRASQFLNVEGSGYYAEGDGGGGEFLAAGTAAISDSTGGAGNGDGDGFADLSEDLYVEGTGWTGSLVGIQQREFDDVAASSFISLTTLSTSNASISGGTLSGYAQTTGSYDGSTVTVRYRIFNDSFEFTDSDSMLVPDITAPNVSSASATALNTIRVVFDEAVSEQGDATGRFSFGGDGSGRTVSTLTAVGSEPTTTWDLTLDSDLPDRDPSSLTVTYTASGGDADELEDAATNEVTSGSNATASDAIAPATPSVSVPDNSTIMDGASVTLTASADAAGTDASMDSVRFEGSNNGSTWDGVGGDSDTGDGTYSYSYTFGTKYAYYRAVAVDDAGNETNAASTVQLTDAYRIEITADPGSIDAGQRGQFTIEIQDNYADAVTYGSNLSFNLSSDQGTGTFWDAASGGSSISSVVITAADTDTVFWYEDTDDGTTPTITVTEAAGNLDDDNDSQQITINASNVDHFHVGTENSESETAGTSFDITITAHDAAHATATDYTGSQSLTWTTTATASPDGTSPVIPSDGSRTFSSGTLTISSAGTLYNSSETPTITVTDGSINTDGSEGAGAGVTVSDGSHAETRIKNADESSDGDYDSNIFNTATMQGATQASPDASLTLFGVRYDAYGNLLSDASGSWALTGDLASGGSLASGSGIDNTYTADTETGSTHSGTITLDVSGNADATGTVDVDDDDGATVSGMNVQTDDLDNRFVVATWNASSSGDDGTSGTPTSFDVRWTVEANGPIDSEGEWNSATTVGTAGKPAFSVGSWHIDMSSFPNGNKYFAIRTTDDVGNVSVLASGAYTTTSDFSLPVSFSAFDAAAGYGQIVLRWSTASEINNEGFILYRSESQDGPFDVPLNQEIIEGQGTTNAQSDYEYEDANVEENTTYYYKLTSRDYDGTVHTYGQTLTVVSLDIPDEFELAQNYPNPFNPTTRLKFSIAETSRATLEIYNVLGQRIRTMFSGEVFQPGVYTEYTWNARDDYGNSVTAGVYYMVFTAEQGNYREIKKMVYIR